MAVWLTKKGEVILIGGKVYTGDTNPCGYAYIQKCTYTAGTATSSPTNTAELLAVQVDNFCTYTDATVWFNKNSGTYPTSGATSYTLLNSQLAGTESAAGWLTCADKSRIKLGTCSYNPKIYYVHSKCDCDAGTTKAIITTSSSNSSYTEHEGPFVYAEAETRYNEVNNKSCTCQWYFAWKCESLCSGQDGGTRTYNVYGPRNTPYDESDYDGVSKAYSSKAAVDAAIETYRKKTCKCYNYIWYVHKKCNDYNEYETQITNSSSPPSGYEYTGKSFDLKNDAISYANSIKGTSCGSSTPSSDYYIAVFIYNNDEYNFDIITGRGDCPPGNFCCKKSTQDITYVAYNSCYPPITSSATDACGCIYQTIDSMTSTSAALLLSDTPEDLQ